MNNQTQIIPINDQAPTLTGGSMNKDMMPTNFADVREMAKYMCQATAMVGDVCRNNPGNSMAVIMQASRWGMDPFMVSHECYDVKGNLAYGAKLINSVILANAPIKTRLNYEYSGEGPTRRVRVFSTFIGEDEPREILTPMVKDIGVKNSPLWKNDPDQQLAYYGARTWARRHAPDVIMGVVTVEEAKAQAAIDVTPRRDPKEQLKAALGTDKLDAPEEAQEPEIATAEVVEEVIAEVEAGAPMVKDMVSKVLGDIADAETVEELNQLDTSMHSDRYSAMTEQQKKVIFSAIDTRINSLSEREDAPEGAQADLLDQSEG